MLGDFHFWNLLSFPGNVLKDGNKISVLLASLFGTAFTIQLHWCALVSCFLAVLINRIFFVSRRQKRKSPSTRARQSSLRKSAIRWCGPSSGWTRLWKGHPTSPPWRLWTSSTVTSVCTEVGTYCQKCSACYQLSFACFLLLLLFF